MLNALPQGTKQTKTLRNVSMLSLPSDFARSTNGELFSVKQFVEFQNVQHNQQIHYVLVFWRISLCQPFRQSTCNQAQNILKMLNVLWSGRKSLHGHRELLNMLNMWRLCKPNRGDLLSASYSGESPEISTHSIFVRCFEVFFFATPPATAHVL